MSVCGGWSLVNYRKVPQRAITLFCRSWQCPDCRPRRLAGLKRDAARGNPSTFITLTVNPQNDETTTERAQHLTDAWRIVVKRARRRWPKEPLEYLAVFEETKKGEPHLHIVARAPYIPQKWLSDQMRELINAPIVDIRKVANKRAVALYIAKYVAKGPRAFGKLKRYWSSPRYAPKTVEKEARDPIWGSGWSAMEIPLWLLADHWRAMGLWVIEENDHCITVDPERRRRVENFYIGPWYQEVRTRR